MNNEEKILQLLTQMQNQINNIESDTKEIKTKVDSITEQTANLTEFRTQANTKLDKISDDVEFLKHQEYETKQDLFSIKRNIRSTK
ncbi:hypothetical protein GOQ29_05995 [Clostridium sp. D2Q-14]|uniref:hypothetical protein n=1 Tax=Anaeromonas gelatinilytica TaxID=2683194 RepID=UPI00193C0C69|nr:hypothetical protein [Anaeromonas gelatinilytica]MBS4535171.1 hypothetical protein [Anaeromonas gelatinilytica]